MDEKDLNGYVDVEGLINESNKNEVDAISELISNVENPLKYVEEVKFDEEEDVQKEEYEPDSTTADEISRKSSSKSSSKLDENEHFIENIENEKFDAEFTNLVSRIVEQEPVLDQQSLRKSEVEIIKPIEITKEATKSECTYCAYCK